jgi:hypothetical protein
MRGLAAALLALAAAGCSTTMDDVIKSREDGTAAVYPCAAETAWNAATDVLWEATNVNPVEHRDRGYVCVMGGLGDDETFICVWITPTKLEGWTNVAVVARRANGFQMGKVLDEDAFHAEFVRMAKIPAPKE